MSNRVARIAAAALLTLAICCGQLWESSTAVAATPPLYTYSYYVSNTSQSHWFQLGKDLGAAMNSGDKPAQALVLLGFGDASYDGSHYGTTSFSGGFLDVPSIRAISEQFGKGFYTVAYSNEQLLIGIGTTNHGSWIADTSDDYKRATNHGSHWGDMVDDCNDWMDTNGYSSQVLCRGGIDAEIGWSGSAIPKHWADGYDSATNFYYFDSGDSAGCPFPSSPSGTHVTGDCASTYTWSQYSVWYMAWGNPDALPLPQIYNEAHSLQWGNIADYSVSVRSQSMFFYGVLSQHAACYDTGDSCAGQDYTPNTGWNKLYAALNCSGCPSHQSPPYLTNIRWNNGVV